MQNLVPVLKITDIEQSKAYYLEGLGFKVDWEWKNYQDDSIFMQISCHDICLYLTNAPECEVGALVYWYVENVDQFHNDLLHKAIGVDALPQNKPWGNREMQISDPDDNKLRICTAV